MGYLRDVGTRQMGGFALLVLTGMLLATGCGQQYRAPDSQDDLQARAARLAQESIIVDTHIDVPYRLQEEQEDISQTTEGGDFDYPRAVEGGLNAPFMSIYTPADLQETGGSKELADSLIDLVEGFAQQWPDKFSVARSPRDVRKDFEAGLISLPMGMENGAPIGDDLANLAYFRDRGISYITLTHGKSNQISDSSYDEDRVWQGLSPVWTASRRGDESVGDHDRHLPCYRRGLRSGPRSHSSPRHCVALLMPLIYRRLGAQHERRDDPPAG